MGYVIRGLFPAPKPCPKPSQGSWIGFEVESSTVIDLEQAQVRGFQGLIRSIPADPAQPSVQDNSEAFAVALTTAPDAYNLHPLGDVGYIRGVLDARLAALGAEPRRTFALALSGGGIGVAFESLMFEPTAADVQAIMQIVMLRAKLADTMGVYDDPAWNGAPIVMTVNGVAV
jgi:hypothetical protein